MDKYFWRQFVVLLSILLHSICDGISVTLPGVMTSSLLSPNSIDMRATPSEASWIAAATGFGSFPGIVLASFLVESIGRKYTHAVIVFFDLLSWIMLTFANDTTTLLVARFARGFGETLSIDGIIICEYSNPKRRGYFSTIRKLCVGLGRLICHTMSLHYSWREVSILASVALLLSFILTLPWCESPAYCAMKGRFKDCERNFLWLHGNSKERREELEYLMEAQMIRMEMDKTKNKIKTLLKTFSEKGFLKALLISLLLILIVDLCGRVYYFAYMKQIFLYIMNDKSFADYCSIGNDLLSIIGVAISCITIKYFKRRTLVFQFGLVTAFLMIVISVSDFLKVKHDIGSHLQWFIPGLLFLLNFIVNLGVVPVNITIAIELFPLEHRGLGALMTCFIGIVFYIVSMKCTNEMLNIFGLYGIYGSFGIGMVICLSILYYLLPETKNKTMQEIEDELKNEDRSNIKTQVTILKENVYNQNVGRADKICTITK